MTPRLALFFLVVGGCVDATKCKLPVDWQPCAGDKAEPGSSGTPPTIVELSLPTCAPVAAPKVTGNLHVSDPDSDANTIKATFFAGVGGVFINEADTVVPALVSAHRDWTVQATLMVGGQPMGGDIGVRVKVTDNAGNQSAPFCNTVTLLQ